MPSRTVTVTTGEGEITTEWFSDARPYTERLSVAHLRGASQGCDLPGRGWNWEVRDDDGALIAEGHTAYGHEARDRIEAVVAEQLGGTVRGVTRVGGRRV